MESGTTAMELITAVIDGPLCFIVAFGAAHNHSYRHPLQIILCTMQLYGLVWFTLQPIYSETGLAGHFSSNPVSVRVDVDGIPPGLRMYYITISNISFFV